MDLKGCQTNSNPARALLQGCQSKKIFVPHQLGQIIYNEFKNKNYQGKIVQRDACEKLFKILYKDGDVEELSHEEVIKYTNRSSNQKYFTTPVMKNHNDHNDHHKKNLNDIEWFIIIISFLIMGSLI